MITSWCLDLDHRVGREIHMSFSDYVWDGRRLGIGDGKEEDEGTALLGVVEVVSRGTNILNYIMSPWRRSQAMHQIT